MCKNKLHALIIVGKTFQEIKKQLPNYFKMPRHYIDNKFFNKFISLYEAYILCENYP